jgi:hypothetical protein
MKRPLLANTLLLACSGILITLLGNSGALARERRVLAAHGTFQEV